MGQRNTCHYSDTITWVVAPITAANHLFLLGTDRRHRSAGTLAACNLANSGVEIAELPRSTLAASYTAATATDSLISNTYPLQGSNASITICTQSSKPHTGA